MAHYLGEEAAAIAGVFPGCMGRDGVAGVRSGRLRVAMVGLIMRNAVRAFGRTLLDGLEVSPGFVVSLPYLILTAALYLFGLVVLWLLSGYFHSIGWSPLGNLLWFGFWAMAIPFIVAVPVAVLALFWSGLSAMWNILKSKGID